MAGTDDKRTLTQRLQSGLARRTRALWRHCFRQGPRFPAEAALDWLIASLADSPPELLAACSETLLDYGCSDVLAGRAGLAALTSVPNGTASASPNFHEAMRSASSVELARAAVHWYRHGELEKAETAFQILERRQGREGNLPSPVRFFPHESSRDRILAVKHYLDAAQMRVAATFEAHGQELPHVIDLHDGRMVTVREWMNKLPATASVADVGCGSGRFLIRLAEEFPQAELTGIDPCPALLDRLPPHVQRHQGTLLRTRLEEATFDGAFAVESLEHCLVAKRGIAELCRIVRPGGRVLVIDKHRSKQPLSEYEPWERWFFPNELIEWLDPFCDEIRVEIVSHSEGQGGTGLFLAAVGRRR